MHGGTTKASQYHHKYRRGVVVKGYGSETARELSWCSCSYLSQSIDFKGKISVAGHREHRVESRRFGILTSNWVTLSFLAAAKLIKRSSGADWYIVVDSAWRDETAEQDGVRKGLKKR